MPKAQLLLIGLTAIALLSLLLPVACNARSTNKDCGFTLCGDVNISYPFRLNSQPRKCGDHWFELECDNDNRTVLVMKYGKFYVQNISYKYKSIRVIDANLGRVDCSFPSNSFREHYCITPFRFGGNIMHLVSCTVRIKSSLYVDASHCPNRPSNSPPYFYFLDGKTHVRDFDQSCTVIALVPIMLDNIAVFSTSAIYEKLLRGFELYWFPRSHGNDRACWGDTRFQVISRALIDALATYVGSFLRLISDRRYLYRENKLCLLGTGGVILLRLFLGISCLIALIVYKLRRRHLSADDAIEEFLQSQNDLMPIRYSYREIKWMTKGFRDKLGEGGYGSVFKGKLRSGHLVAVKLLGKAKANGQDFISEVATIGRIHHVNVAKLRGFCVEGMRQALVYDFMPNGSLDKFIFAKENHITLSRKQIFDIALGVGRGIDYLHRGCDMQILHFDIKPHNILLDEKFIPKVSDFGLAKLYSVDDSIVSLTAARGTIGYIAPELVYKNFGGISYKADVYSYGMLLMEMVGGRKNFNAFDEQSSQRYFPSWIYNQIRQGDEFNLGDEIAKDEMAIVKKMIITAFWCIQVMPSDRPSMSKVLEMLETDVDLLEMPPKPFQLPFEVSVEDHACYTEDSQTDEPTTSLVSSSYERSLTMV